MRFSSQDGYIIIFARVRRSKYRILKAQRPSIRSNLVPKPDWNHFKVKRSNIQGVFLQYTGCFFGHFQDLSCNSAELIIPPKIDFFCNLTTFQEFNKFHVLPLSHFDSHEKPTLNRYWHFKIPECQNLQNCSSNPASDQKNTLYIAKIHPVYLTF